MEYTKEQEVMALQTLVASSITLYRVEELHRAGFIVHQDKQVLNRTISMLKKKDIIFNKLDKAVSDNLDPLLVDLEEYIDVIASVPTDYYRIIADTIQNDILDKDKHPLKLVFEKAFKDLKEGKNLVEVSEISDLERQLNKFI